MTGTPATTAGRRATEELLAGSRAMAPVVAAYVPFGLLVGASVAATSSPWLAWGATVPMYGGAAQLAVLELVNSGSGWPTAALVGVVVQARLAAYATAMAPGWHTASRRRRLVAALLLTDAPWAVSRGRSQEFYLGAGFALAVTWPFLVALGAVVGSTSVPGAAVLMPLTLGAVLAPQLRRREALVAVLVASSAALVTRTQDSGTALFVAAATAAAAGSLVRATR